ncbi:peptidoglycan editing factor PgeF [Acuticoccus kalidii]|uniref:peptidoglycan editing factor PgeF n=1 Tax=Acuticoccus kalidii TaxID=2910977 RepID=UPI003F706362
MAADALTRQGLRHAFFTRQGGVSDGIYHSLNAGRGSADAPDKVDENRKRIASAMGVAVDRLVTMHQVHSRDVLTVTDIPAERPKLDAMVTARPGLALGVLTADCAPILFADPQAGVIGAAHSGWRGATSGILEATLEAMIALGARASDTIAVIGPTIAQASYEVGPEFIDGVVAARPDTADLFRPSTRPDHHLFDLPAYIDRRAHAAGIGTVVDLALDTYADEARFFSYRRATHRGEPDYGRLISAIVLEG